VFRSLVMLLVGLALYLGIVEAVQALSKRGPEPVGWLPALALVLVPALIWLAYFYLLDRYEPEPTHYVLSTFLLGALVAAPLANLLINDLFSAERWIALAPFSPQHVAASFLVVGTAQELAKYLVVRYTVYLSDEFDEPADGIVYATAAGIGFATHVNFQYVASGVLLEIGALNVTITTLAHACFSGVVGYSLGRAKFASRSQTRTLAVGLCAAIALNGVFYLLQDLVVRPGLELRPWRGLLLSGAFALAVFGAIVALMRRSLRRGGPAAAASGAGGAP
jgi:RsiW-degrading membrane proteinase PrsW (M82 family)